jgi:L-aminopeptidase/D-esterase-like protein
MAATDYSGRHQPPRVPELITMNHAHSTHYTDSPDARIPHVLRGWRPDGGPANHDIKVGDMRVRPDAAGGYAACEAASTADPAEGNVGAGTGATVGKCHGRDHWCKGGIGTASVRLPSGATVAALVAVNAFGDVLGEDGAVIAGAWEEGRGFVDSRLAMLDGAARHARVQDMSNTTLCVIATDARLDKPGCTHLARQAHAGLARAIAPYGTALDGDIAFAVSTGQIEANPVVVGNAVAEVATRAVRDAVRQATSVRGVPTSADLTGR